MINVVSVNKEITNTEKLIREIKANVIIGSLYNYLNIKGNDVEVYFNRNLIQTEIDECTNLVNNFVNTSLYDYLYNYLKMSIDPFVDELLITIRAENIELGISQSNKTTEVLGFFEQQHMLPGRTRSVSLQGSLNTGSLTVTIEILNYLIANPNLYSDINPFVTTDRLTIWKNKIIGKLSS